ncbi:hypothetical protein [Methylopila sp. 73B]|uniref:hypothetical protein n=1 Tax=Methylopila sp. 73B TaxID=1120792 RepID=UPI000368608D|nr:hypothetical protein [Methylopila sp. 73B]
MTEVVEIMARGVWTRHCQDLGLPSRAANFPLVEGHAEYMANAKAALSALEVEGWRVVPAEPDDAMRLASKRYKRGAKIPTGPGFYAAMLASAPKHGGDND